MFDATRSESPTTKARTRPSDERIALPGCARSPILMAYPNAQILALGEPGIAPIAYEETEHFTITRDFLNRYPTMLRVLLEEDRPAP